jgi:pilus assembly protein CpaF
MSMQLVVTDDAGVSTRISLAEFPCLIGRGKDNAVVLPGWRVAKVHAQIHKSERILRLVDSGTLNGTWVNGQRIAEYAPLDETDEILIGGYSLKLEIAPLVVAIDVTSGFKQHSNSATAQSVDTKSVDHFRGFRRDLHQQMIRAIDLRRKDVRQLNDQQLRNELTTLLNSLLDQHKSLPLDLDRTKLIEEMLSEAIGLGPLDALLADPTISEVMVNSANEVFVEKEGRLYPHNVSFSSDEAIRAIIDRIVQPIGRRIDDASPMVDARLPDGSRVNAIIPPLALRGPSITIRKFIRNHFTPQAMVDQGSLSLQMLQFLTLCVSARKNVVISGGTGSGKTTLLNILSCLIPEHERIVTIEDSAELKLHHRNLVSLESRPANVEGRGAISIRDLVRNSLRMRPDRIVVGEVRGGEALDMLQAMNTGHDGSLTTVHANTARDVFSRLEVMSLMAGIDLPITALREQICSAVDVIVHQSRFADGARRISSIVEVTGMEAGRIQSQELFRYQEQDADSQLGFVENTKVHAQSPRKGIFKACGVVPDFYEALGRAGNSLDYSLFESSATRN